MAKAFSYRNEASVKINVQGHQEKACSNSNQSSARVIKYLSSDDLVLDIGCGSGKRACDIARYVKQVTGIDRSREKIGLATWRAEQSNLSNLKFEVADVLDESLDGQKFNAIVALNAFDFGSDSHDIMPKLNSLLESGGKLLLRHPCLGEGRSFFRNIRALFSRRGWASPCAGLSVAELENMVTGANFYIEDGLFINPVTSDYFILATKQ